jgi:hypothetical protein
VLLLLAACGWWHPQCATARDREEPVRAPPAVLEGLKALWQALARNSSSGDAARRTLVRQTLQRAAGIYADPPPAHLRREVNRTVLVNVVSYTAANTTYKAHLQNWFCFLNHFRLKTVVYRVERGPAADLARYSPRAHVLTYPDSLLWSIVARKRAPLLVHKEHGDYGGSVPSFAKSSAYSG